MRHITRRLAPTLLTASLLSACVAYEPSPTDISSKYDQVWSAALSGAADAGITITSLAPTIGTIRGQRNGIGVTIEVSRLPDGRVQLRFDRHDPGNRDPELGNQFTQAYQHRMGRKRPIPMPRSPTPSHDNPD